MVINCPKIVKMIKKHPKLMSKVVHTFDKDKTPKTWHNICKTKPVDAMGVVVHGLLELNRELK